MPVEGKREYGEKLTSEREKDKEKLPPRTRQRASLSCRECRRRKQKCNQAKDRPCNNCVRRYPPVECVYDTFSSNAASVSERRSDSRERIPDRAALHDGNLVPLAERSRFTIPSRLRTPLPYARVEASASSLIPRAAGSRAEDDEVLQLNEVQRQVRELSPATRERLQTHSGSTYDISAIFLVDRPRAESHYFNQFDASRYGINLVPAPIGASAESTLTHLPIDATRRNAELLHFFVQRLSPFTSSIDGHNPSPSFTSQWITLMIQSPLVVYLSILSAAYFQATARRIVVEKSVDAMTIKTKLIGLINEHITGAGGRGVSDEAVAAVMSLSYNELIYSDKKSVFAHMSGLRSMIRSRGGIDCIHPSVLRFLIARTDYQVSMTFECDPFVHPPRSTPFGSLSDYPLHLDSPFLVSPRRFAAASNALNIPLETAHLLDDMRFLTTSIHALLHSPESPAKQRAATTKFAQTATWLQNRLTTSRPPSPETPFHQTIHTTALILLAAITSRKLLSQSCSADLLQRLWGSMWRVPLLRWKQIPGVFLWVLLVVNPAVRSRPEGRFIKGMVAAGFVGIGVDSWDVVMGIVRGCGAVQLWLERDGDGGDEGPVGEDGEDEKVVKDDDEEEDELVKRERVEKVIRVPERVLND